MEREDLIQDIRGQIVVAFLSGMSVVEITRALKKGNVEFVHSFLRSIGHIKGMDKESYHQSFDIDWPLEAALRKIGYTFARWCKGWGFDPAVAELVLKDRSNVDHTPKEHEAMKRDFPETYAKVFGKDTERASTAARAKKQYPTILLTWDSSRQAYVAEIPGPPVLNACGASLDHAFERIKEVWKLYESLLRLKSAMENHTVRESF
ncbi:hypothetical protein GURASL_04270 [Geotalea uraniireducens]|uniref:Uncharacterized protein n=1 Tax=Geotalea uraniireducens TaxID=351604 RepID=A0ABM8EGF8_9BACT|nr:type II toxin-antitoxin system HicB family antitoxin [Geotalea uraniireducens]BDV41504.1 hypothetical protein GURASL_04270 [Geotalea uraniireducens]